MPLVARPWGFNHWCPAILRCLLQPSVRFARDVRSPQTNYEGSGWFFHPADKRFFGIRCTHQPYTSQSSRIFVAGAFQCQAFQSSLTVPPCSSPWIGDYGHFLIAAQMGAAHVDAWNRSAFASQLCTLDRSRYPVACPSARPRSRRATIGESRISRHFTSMHR